MPPGQPLLEELAQRSDWLIRYRWAAAVAVAAGSLLGPLAIVPGLSCLACCVIAGGMVLYNLFFRWLAARMRRTARTATDWGRLASGQFLTDGGALILLVHLTGGLSSPLLPFFVFHAIIASVLLPPRASYLHAVAAVALVGSLASLEFHGVLPNRAIAGLWRVRPDDLLAVGVSFGFFAVTVIVSNHLAGSLARRLWARTRETLALKDDIERDAARVRSLHAIARTVNSTLDLKVVLSQIAETSAAALRAKACSIRLLDADRRRLQVSAAFGLSPEYLAKGDIDVSRSPIDQAAMQGWAVQVPDVAKSQAFQYPEEAAREGIGSVLCAPLVVRGSPIGVLRVYSADRREYPEEDLGFLMAIASQGAASIENARAYQRLAEADEAKSRFVFMVAHELKAPVAAVRQFLSVLEGGYAGEVTPKQHELLVRSTARMKELQGLIGDLLALGSLKNRPAAHELVPVRLGEALARVRERVAGLIEDKRIALEIEDAGEAAIVRADPDDLGKLVGNLLENAVKYTPEGGSVTVRIERVGERARMTFRDTGIGIPAESLERLFEEFYRAPNAKKSHPGTGLGLALVKRIVDLYHGTISVVSTVGEGTTFVVELPAGQ